MPTMFLSEIGIFLISKNIIIYCFKCVAIWNRYGKHHRVLKQLESEKKYYLNLIIYSTWWQNCNEKLYQ